MPGQVPNENTSGVENSTGNAAIPGGISASPKGWYSRGYLPHLDQPNLIQAVTFRLHDSVPEETIRRWKDELRWHENLPNDAPAKIALKQRIVTYEDAGYGACWLRDERIARLVQNALLRFDGERYQY